MKGNFLDVSTSTGVYVEGPDTSPVIDGNQFRLFFGTLYDNDGFGRCESWRWVPEELS